MRRGKILRGDQTLIESVEVAERLPDRMRGLLGRDALAPGCGLMIKRCGSIHTFGMSFPIDLIFLDKAGRVVRLARTVRPGRIVVGGRRARSVIEMQCGWFDLEQLGTGDVLRLLV